jgi:hypothetical protein
MGVPPTFATIKGSFLNTGSLWIKTEGDSFEIHMCLAASSCFISQNEMSVWIDHPSMVNVFIISDWCSLTNKIISHRRTESGLTIRTTEKPSSFTT